MALHQLRLARAAHFRKDDVAGEAVETVWSH